MNPTPERKFDVDEYLRGLSLEQLGIDRSTDPYGLGFSWLETPQSSFEKAYDKHVNQEKAQLAEVAGPAMRSLILADSLASGTNLQLLEDWAKVTFPLACQQEGEEGRELLTMLKKSGNSTRGFIAELTTFLEKLPELGELTEEQRVALAVFIIKEHCDKPRK